MADSVQNVPVWAPGPHSQVVGVGAEDISWSPRGYKQKRAPSSTGLGAAMFSASNSLQLHSLFPRSALAFLPNTPWWSKHAPFQEFTSLPLPEVPLQPSGLPKSPRVVIPNLFPAPNKKGTSIGAHIQHCITISHNLPHMSPDQKQDISNFCALQPIHCPATAS